MKVSIITVCYNSADTIEDTIHSVLNQKYSDIEYIIIDGGSHDGTVDIVNKYISNIKYFISEPDNGIYDGMNKGINNASGELIGILNSDDVYIDENVISSIVNKIGDSMTIYADLVYVDRYDLNKITRLWKSGEYIEGSFIWGWMPPHPTFFARKECYQKYGLYNLDLNSASDYELMLRFIHKFKLSIIYFPRVITKMRKGGISNLSLLNRVKANREDKYAWKINDLKPGVFTFLLKPLRKANQFFYRKNNR